MADADLVLLLCGGGTEAWITGVLRNARDNRSAPGNQHLILIVLRNHRNGGAETLGGVLSDRYRLETHQIALFAFPAKALGERILRSKEACDGGGNPALYDNTTRHRVIKN